MSTTTDRAQLISDDERAGLLGVADTLREVLQAQVPLARLAALEPKERQRLREFCRRLRSTPEAAQVASFDQRASAEAFAEGVEKLPTSSARLRREQALLATYTRELGFMPTAEERLVFRGVPADVTLDGLRGQLAAVAPQWRGMRVNWADLTHEEQEELEQLVEKALGEPRYFKERRGENASRLRIGMLARHAENGSPQRSLMPEGWIALAPGLLDDVHAGRLQPLDLAVLTVFVLTLQSRRVHPAREHVVRFDGDTLIVGGGASGLLTDWDPGAHDLNARTISPMVNSIVARLSRAGWLKVDKGSGNDVRVRLGDRLTASGNA